VNPEIRKRWVDALRSGEYQQGVGSLRTGGDKYCCLGVLCEIAVADGVIERFDPEANGTFSDKHSYGVPENKQWSHLPLKVQKWANLAASNPMVRRDGWGYPLAHLNDLKVPFSEIADCIEASL
jgi:hypothetical protein